MKRKFSFILAMIFSVMILLPVNSEARIVERMTAQISSDIIITVNGERVPFKAAIINGTSYLPVRVIGYALNSEVDWIQSQKKITLDTREERLPYQEFSDLVSINSGYRTASRRDDMSLYLNNEYYRDISKQIIVIENRSYLPIRSVSENLGIRSTWNPETRTIEVVNPRTVNISEKDKPYYVKELPKIEKQEDYLVGNWAGYDSFEYDEGLFYNLDSAIYITKNNNGTYNQVTRYTFNDVYDTQFNGLSFVIEYYDCEFNEWDNTLVRDRDNCEVLSNDLDFDIYGADAPLYLQGEVLSADYGDSTDARYRRF